jgi:hypothetical protein
MMIGSIVGAEKKMPSIPGKSVIGNLLVGKNPPGASQYRNARKATEIKT